tara:strand:- start:1536 stop:2024 length:489 start_codon:yes stop_codon:yes gene_type:complete
MAQCGSHKGSDAEGRARDRQITTIRKDAATSLGMLREQYDKLGAPDNMVMKGADFEQKANADQFQQQSAQLQQTIGKSNLAGSGGQTRARENLADAFKSKQEFTREKALDEQASSLDKLTMEMHNIISTTRASLKGISGDTHKSKEFTKDHYGDMSAYGIDD